MTLLHSCCLQGREWKGATSSVLKEDICNQPILEKRLVVAEEESVWGGMDWDSGIREATYYMSDG